LAMGMMPSRNKNFYLLNLFNRLRIFCFYAFYSIGGLIIPLFIYTKLKHRLYRFYKGSSSSSVPKKENAAGYFLY
jgi:hypothetical protein